MRTRKFNMAKNFAGRVGAVALGAVVALGLWVGVGGSMGAAPRVPDAVTCLPNPTCDIDGRSFVVAGNDPTTLSAQAITIGLTYTPGEPVVNFEIFDADHLTNWDTPLNCGTGCPDNGSPGPQLLLKLFRDPDADGTGADIPGNIVATWTPVGGVPGFNEQGPFAATNNLWALGTVPHNALAEGLDGDFHYALVIAPFSPDTNKGWNAFKIRAEGTVALLGNQIVGFIGAMNAATSDLTTIYPNFPALNPTVYNGKWVFATKLPFFLDDVTVYDGDMDFGNEACQYNDTDDPDSIGIPFFDLVPASVAEGIAKATGNLPCKPSPGPNGETVRTGSPAEDGTIGGAFTRVPTIVPNGIAYLLRAPDGQIFLNQNPSGNKEWEKFKIQRVNAGQVTRGACPPKGTLGLGDPGGYFEGENGYPASDCRTTSLPGGNWQVELDGMDLANLNFWYFSFKVEVPVNEYSIGRLVWFDTNQNGVQDGGEVGVPGVLVNIYDGPLPGGNFVTSAVTDGNGEFLITLDNEVLDPLLDPGNYTIQVAASNFDPGGPLFGYTSTTGGEVQNGIEVGLPICTDTNVPVGCGQPLYDEALFGYAQVSGVGVTAYTNTTCQDYIGGNIVPLTSLLYSQSGNTISNVVPGAMFFWTTVTVGPGQALTVTQSHTGTGAGPLLLHGNQGRILTTNCSLVVGWSATQNTTTGTVSFPAVPPGTYVVQIKFAPKSLNGTPIPNPATIFYTFMAALNGVPQPSTKNDPALALGPK